MNKEEGKEGGKEKGKKKKTDAKDKEEEEYKWRNSVAQEKLREDLIKGRIPLEDDGSLTTEEAFLMRQEFVQSGWRLWPSRLRSTREQVTRDIERARDDTDCYRNYTERREASNQSTRGYPEWEGHPAQKQLGIDLKELEEQERHMTPKELWQSNEVYLDFPLKVFSDHIHQHVRTEKYLHTLREHGKAYGKPWKKK